MIRAEPTTTCQANTALGTWLRLALSLSVSQARLLLYRIAAATKDKGGTPNDCCNARLFDSQSTCPRHLIRPSYGVPPTMGWRNLHL